ncbi:Ccc1 family [Thamnocephalis sphaerospora]|uniref:Ccc1 family n=1 Tax=Thamnocephalis sphaerospora TaxID=78915 RepID=A0A4P9XQJ7_9FUNG|nr:Ccc1 family [Thamnocephalis sphaerospora]|eukprot:RKP08316.1 Ccc1 family [Thamnocephalis sphaerospora]
MSGLRARRHVHPPHTEEHFRSPETVRDAILGLSDGLTVPFALAAGLSSLDNSQIVVAAGCAELVAGAISMGLGGYLATVSEIEHYDAERERERAEVRNFPHEEEAEILDILAPYGLDQEALQPVIERLRADPERWVDFMMRFELNLERPDPARTWICALTIGFSYLIGGLVPLLPYFFIQHARTALGWSVGVTLTALFIFGYIKTRLLSARRVWRGAFQTMLVGALAAASAYALVALFNTA